MGTGLAETLGVGKSGQFKKHLCIIGDGSFNNISPAVDCSK